MIRSFTKAKVAVLPRESDGRRVTISLLMVLSILLMSLFTSSVAHASLDASQAGVEQSVEGKGQPSSLDGPDEAPRGKSFGSASHCTGHCSSHAVGLLENHAESAVVHTHGIAWPALSGAELAMNPSTRLERPPRL